MRRCSSGAVDGPDAADAAWGLPARRALSDPNGPELGNESAIAPPFKRVHRFVIGRHYRTDFLQFPRHYFGKDDIRNKIGTNAPAVRAADRTEWMSEASDDVRDLGVMVDRIVLEGAAHHADGNIPVSPGGGSSP